MSMKQHITVLETWEKRKDGIVYRVWEFPNGEKIETPTPHKEIPVSTLK